MDTNMAQLHTHRAVTVTLLLALGACGLLLRGSDQARSAPGAPAPANFWTLGVYTGPSPFELSPPASIANPVLRGADVTDLKVDTLAHPFMLLENSRYYMFFTAKDLKTDKGGIGLAESGNGLEWKYRRIVIHEPFVLAHPFIFKWQRDYYMIPEAHTETSVRLYRATAFPDRWTYEKDLLTGDHFISPTLVRFKDMWWMFICRPGNDTLRLFYARDFKGPWTEHPSSPIVNKDLKTARPGGRPFVLDGKLYRLGQDCSQTYGYQVRAFQITAISPTTYAETMVDSPVVKASAKGWNAEAMHHVDAHEIGHGRWIAAVDALGR